MDNKYENTIDNAKWHEKLKANYTAELNQRYGQLDGIIQQMKERLGTRHVEKAKVRLKELQEEFARLTKEHSQAIKQLEEHGLNPNKTRT